MARTRAESAVSLRRLYEAKAKAEIAEADAILPARPRVKGAGDLLGRVLLVKGRPGRADLASGTALAGEDGEAARKALEALGLDPASTWADVSRPGDSTAEAAARRLQLIIEAIDPGLVLALDDVAAQDVAASAGLEALPPGQPLSARGRTLGAVSGLEASLADPPAKTLVWKQMKAIAAALLPAGSSGTRTGRPKAPRTDDREGPRSG